MDRRDFLERVGVAGMVAATATAASGTAPHVVAAEKVSIAMIFFGTEGMVEQGRWEGGRYAFRVYDRKGDLVHGVLQDRTQQPPGPNGETR